MRELEDKVVCSVCVDDRIIKAEIRSGGGTLLCSYCGHRRKCIALPDLAKRVDDIYREHVRFGSEEYAFDGDGEPYWTQRGSSPEELIGEMLKSEGGVAADIASHLSDQEAYDVCKDGADAYYDSTSAYTLAPSYDPAFALSWNDFVESIKHATRFFAVRGAAQLDEIFRDLKDLDYHGSLAPIRMIRPTSEERFIFRARRTNTEAERIAICLAPARLLGPPPKEVAPSGRMNALGVSTFYGAFDAETCVAELRLAIGEAATSCKFEIIRPLRVLDLTVLRKVHKHLSIFDGAYTRVASKVTFLNRLEQAISRPVRPGSELEYLPTQALAEYLALKYSPTIDAVIYSSTQGKGRNIVVLNHAAIVRGVGAGDGATARYQESWDEDGYCIVDQRGARRKKHAAKAKFVFFEPGEVDGRLAPPRPHLKVVRRSLMVHRVTAIEQKMTSDEVRLPVVRERDLPF